MRPASISLILLASLFIALGRRWTWRAKKRHIKWQRRYLGWAFIYTGIIVMIMAIILW